MVNKTYKTGFIDACLNYGLSKSASESLYKNAQILPFLGRIGGRIGGALTGPTMRQFIKGIFNIGKGVGDVGAAAGKGTLKGLDLIRKGVGRINNAEGVNLSRGFAKALSGKNVRKIPLVKDFAKGFVGAQRAYERSGGTGSKLLANFGLGKGGLIGNTMSGFGSFTAAHPYLGALGYTLPAALIARRMSEGSNDEGTIDTMTPAERRAFERIFRGGGYSGLGFDADDVNSFSYL